MPITLELSEDDVRFLRDQLNERLSALDAELVRTDRRRLQHALAEDARRLQGLVERITTVVG